MSAVANGKMRPQERLRWPRGSFDPAPFMSDDTSLRPCHVTEFGALYAADCMAVLPSIKTGSIHTVFADPPFNLGKEYGESTNDRIPEQRYVDWCRAWLDECVRVLRPGGSLFLYNLPKWNLLLGAHLMGQGLTFRHWIAVEISACLPIPGRLHPSHYSLLYFSKGKPATFRRIRTPVQTCRHCGGEIKDYGGHRDALNPKGVNLKDVWSDIPPVRHWKFKSKERSANALSTKLLDRVVEMSTARGDIVLDPFGGSGTTFVVCEKKARHWIGTEIDFAPVIVERLESDEISHHQNSDVVDAR